MRSSNRLIEYSCTSLESTESAQVCERGGHGIRKDLELGHFQGSPKAQPRYMHKAVGSNILSEFEETFLLKILNAFHSRQYRSVLFKYTHKGAGARCSQGVAVSTTDLSLATPLKTAVLVPFFS